MWKGRFTDIQSHLKFPCDTKEFETHTSQNSERLLFMKLFKSTFAVFAVTLCLCTAVAFAESTEPVDSHPGFVSLTPESLATENLVPEVEVNVTEPLIRLAIATALGAADSASGESPEAAQLKQLLDGIDLHLVQVRVFESPEIDSAIIENGKKIVEDLRDDGWVSVVRVAEDDENVNVLIRSDDKYIRGGFISVMEQGEMVLMNIVADIDPEANGHQIGQLLGGAMNGQFDVKQLEKVLKDLMGG